MKNENNLIRIKLTLARPDDLRELQDLFMITVPTVCTNDYTPEPIQAWLSGVDNHNCWLGIVPNR